MSILERAQKMIEKPGFTASDLCRIYLKRIEHIYFKFDPAVMKQKNVSVNSKINFDIIESQITMMNSLIYPAVSSLCSQSMKTTHIHIF